MRRRLIPSLLLSFSLPGLAIGCGRDTNAAATVAEGTAPAHLVHATRVDTEDRTETIRLVGSVEPIHDVTVSAEVQGTIRERLKGVGDVVQEGDALFRIDDARLRLAVTGAQAELLRLKATLEQKRRDLKRAEDLFVGKVASEDVIEKARTELHVAEAVVLAQETALERLRRDLDDTRVQSPIDGHVVEYFLDVGEFVSAGTQLMRVVDTSRVKVQTRVNEVDVAKLRVGTSVGIQVDAYPDRGLEGSITAIAAQADRATRTFPVEIELANSDDRPLLAGMVARVAVPGDAYPGVIVVPQDIIVERAGRRLVFVVQPDGTVDEREVTFGALFGPDVVIATGLKAGDEVVTRGQFTLNDGDKVHVVEAT